MGKSMTFPFKKFVRKGEKYIMVENGKPEYVVMHYDDYAELIDRKSAESAADAAVSDIPDFTAETVLSGPNLPEDISKIRLEDLPL
ncbi:MAG: hypothetical protein WAP51_03950 [Candidatus Sungiibacteriota bacterium]